MVEEGGGGDIGGGEGERGGRGVAQRDARVLVLMRVVREGLVSWYRGDVLWGEDGAW